VIVAAGNGVAPRPCAGPSGAPVVVVVRSLVPSPRAVGAAYHAVREHLLAAQCCGSQCMVSWSCD